MPEVSPEIGERIAHRMREVMGEGEWARMFIPEGTAEQIMWDCEDGYVVAYTKEPIKLSRDGRDDGKYAVMVYKPIGKGARTGQAEEWKRCYKRVVAKRKTARAIAEKHFYRHSPETAKRHGVLDK